MTDYGLTFGDLDFGSAARRAGETSARGFWFEVAGADFTLGQSQPVSTTLRQLQDGDLVTRSRDENREPGFTVTVCGTTPDELEAGESALHSATGKQTSLVWTPPHEGATSASLWVFDSWLEHPFDNRRELRLRRRYILRMIAAPFARSVEETIEPALVAGTAPDLVISDGTAATGWTGDGPVSASGGVLRQVVDAVVTPTPDYGGGSYFTTRASFVRSGAVDLSGGRSFVTVDYAEVDRAYRTTAELVADGVATFKLAEQWNPASQMPSATFLVTDPTVTRLEVVVSSVLRFYPTGTAPDPATEHRIDNLTARSTPPGSTTGRQSVRRVPVRGSARTQGSLAIEHPTQGLDETLIYFSSRLGNGYTPSLRPFKTQGPEATSDTSTVSGAREGFGAAGTGGTVFNYPAALLPEGPFLLLGRLRMAQDLTATREVAFTASTRIGAARLGLQDALTGPMDLSRQWSIQTIGTVTLPTTGVVGPGAAGSVELTIPDADGIEWDDLWLCHMDETASLTVVRAGAGTPAVGSVHNRLWLDSESFTYPRPRILVGTREDRSDAFDAGDLARGWSTPTFTPSEVLAQIVTPGAVNPEVTFRHTPQWFLHPVAPDAERT